MSSRHAPAQTPAERDGPGRARERSAPEFHGVRYQVKDVARVAEWSYASPIFRRGSRN